MAMEQIKVHCVSFESSSSGSVNWYFRKEDAEKAFSESIEDPVFSRDTITRFDAEMSDLLSPEACTKCVDEMMSLKDYTPLQIRVGEDGCNQDVADKFEYVKNSKFFADPRGITWAVRYVRESELYGRDLCLVHEEEDPLVEFYDTRYPHTPIGQFVSRYFLSTLLERCTSDERGIMLDPEPSWSVSGVCLKEILGWAKALRVADLLESLLACFNDEQEIEDFTVSDDSDEIYQAKDGTDPLFRHWLSDCRLQEAIEYLDLTS